jgi:hypothetical protein
MFWMVPRQRILNQPPSLHREMLKIQILDGSGMTIFKELETE